MPTPIAIAPSGEPSGDLTAPVVAEAIRTAASIAEKGCSGGDPLRFRARAIWRVTAAARMNVGRACSLSRTPLKVEIDPAPIRTKLPVTWAAERLVRR